MVPSVIQGKQLPLQQGGWNSLTWNRGRCRFFHVLPGVRGCWDHFWYRLYPVCLPWYDKYFSSFPYIAIYMKSLQVSEAKYEKLVIYLSYCTSLPCDTCFIGSTEMHLTWQGRVFFISCVEPNQAHWYLSKHRSVQLTKPNSN